MASPLWIGTDVVDLDRFRLALRRTPSRVERVFTEGERAYSLRKKDPRDSAIDIDLMERKSPSSTVTSLPQREWTACRPRRRSDSSMPAFLGASLIATVGGLLALVTINHELVAAVAAAAVAAALALVVCLLTQRSVVRDLLSLGRRSVASAFVREP